MTGATACTEQGSASAGTQEPNSVLMGVFNIRIDYTQPQKIAGAYNPNYLPVTNKVKIASITDGTSNTAMWGEITRGVSVTATETTPPINSPLEVLEWPAGTSGFTTNVFPMSCMTQTGWLRYRGQE